MTATTPEIPTAFDPEALLAALTLEEKASLVCGVDLWHLPAVPRLGIGAIRMTDGPAGARGTQYDGGKTSALFPSPIMLAATRNPALAEQVGAALAIESKAKGAHVLLGPTVNLVRHPLAGRNFECFGEDPDLTAALAAAFVRGVQSEGVAACPKHLVANDQETARMTVSAEVDERTLREVYLKPFHAAMVDAGAWTCMAAYNRLNGTYCSEDPWLLTTVLRDEWGWDGAVISDWGAVHTTGAAIAAGCDIEMPGPSRLRGQALVAAIEAGEVDVAHLDRSVRRVLLLAHRVGALGPPGSPPTSGDEQDTGTEPRLRGLLRAISVAGTVVLQDDGSVLPLPPTAKVAIVGPQGVRLHVGGGGSAALRPPHVVHAPDALTAAGFEVVVEPGCPPNRPLRFDPDRTEVTVEEMASDGTLRAARIGRISRWLGLRDVPPWVRITLDHTAVANGRYTLRIHTFSDVTVSFDGEVKHQGAVGDRLDIPVYLFQTKTHRFVIEAHQHDADFAFCDVRLMDPPDKAMFDRAIAAARAADYAVVIVGLDEDDDCEGFDRRHFALPAEQVTLARAVVSAQRRTVVVVNAGAPVDLSWVEDLPCVLWLSPPGQEGGYALADVLTGAVPATGRLPFTIPKRIEDTPAFTNFPGDGETVVYAEGDLLGWRWHDAHGIEPRYRFGHGRATNTNTNP